MNRAHHWYCSREAWKRHVREEILPPAIDGLKLDGAVLEVRPGFGPATEVLSRRSGRLTAIARERPGSWGVSVWAASGVLT